MDTTTYTLPVWHVNLSPRDCHCGKPARRWGYTREHGQRTHLSPQRHRHTT